MATSTQLNKFDIVQEILWNAMRHVACPSNAFAILEDLEYDLVDLPAEATALRDRAADAVAYAEYQKAEDYLESLGQ